MSTLRSTCAVLADKRRGKKRHYLMGDIGMAALSVFFMQSRRAHRCSPISDIADGHGNGHSNCKTLFGMVEIPSDKHIRDMLDPVEPGIRGRHALR
jgi:hypothetical protein